mmetsp:Transcript_152109/g.268555  ORF Transcript_152109/g.268555 Transcript_152109/m.268555 type:complete len:626 (-) Transcript_152109:85-1962(-)
MVAESRRAQLQENDLRKFLGEARPGWRVSQVIVAENKLRKIGIDSVPELLAALKVAGHLDELFRFHGEKAFPEETFKALVVQAAKAASAVEASPASAAPASSPETRQLQSTAAAEPRPPEQARRRPAAAAAAAAPPADVELAMAPKASEPTSTPPPASPPAPAPRVVSEFASAELEQKVQEMRQFCREKGFNVAWAEQMAEEELKKERARKQQFANWKRAKAPEKDQRSDVQQSFQPPPRRQAEDVEWFCVVFSKVFAKKAPDEKAKSWGFVYRGQMLEVLGKRATDARGREWVELTPFELWRSCLRSSNPEHGAESENRAFCLIDGVDMKLGALLSGPVPRSEWPVVSPDDVRDFAAWSGQVQNYEDPTCARQLVEVVPTNTAASQVKVEDDRKDFSPELPDYPAREEIENISTLERKAAKEVQVNEGDEVKDVLSEQAGLKMAKAGLTFRVQSRDREVAQGCDLDIQKRLRQALANADEAPNELCVAITWAKAFGVKEGLIISAEQKLADLEKEGEYGRMVRQARELLAKASREPELRDVIEHCQSRGLREVAAEAQAALQKVLAEQAAEQSEHAELLERFKAAIRAGQAPEIKAVRDAARAAGVPKKELARVFALAQEEASC